MHHLKPRSSDSTSTFDNRRSNRADVMGLRCCKPEPPSLSLNCANGSIISNCCQPKKKNLSDYRDDVNVGDDSDKNSNKTTTAIYQPTWALYRWSYREVNPVATSTASDWIISDHWFQSKEKCTAEILTILKGRRDIAEIKICKLKR